MDEEDEELRVYSLLRSPLPSHLNDESYDITTQRHDADNRFTGLLEDINSVYENLRFRPYHDDFNAPAVTYSAATNRSGNDQVKVSQRDNASINKDFDSPTALPSGSIQNRFVDNYMRIDRQPSDATDSDIENKTSQKLAYRQQLRKSSLIHVSDTNSIPVLEGLRQWASYRRISREKSQDGLNDTRSLYETPYESLNPYLTHRRAPRSYPQLPTEWGQINDETGTKVSSLETYNSAEMLPTTQSSADVEEELRAPPRRPPPRKNAVRKKTKPILKRKISIMKNDLKSNISKPEDNRTWLSERLDILNRTKAKPEKLGNDNPERDRTSEEKEEKAPFFYCRLITEFPKTAFVVTLCGHLLIMIVTVILLLSQYDLFPTDFENLPMYDWSVPWRRRDMAWRFRDEYDDRYIRKLYLQSLPKWYRSMEYARGNIMLFYDAGDGNVYTKEKFERIKSIENSIVTMPEYLKYCVQDASFRCVKPKSILRYFDGTYENINPVFYDPTFDRIPAILYAAANDNRTKKDFSMLLDKEHVITSQYAHASLARSIIPLGFPMKDFKSIPPMETEIQNFLVKSFKPAILDLTENTKEFDLVYWSYLLFMVDIADQASKDILLALGSVTFIFCFIIYHTKSLWISTFAVMSIGSSFLAANMIYRIVLDFRYFGLFHIIAIFIILGIGADDLFVFIDVWKNSAFNSYQSLAHRLSDAYKRSIFSMFITSLTTVIAFFASSFSPLLPAKSFGVFAGLLVIVNYISVVFFFPTVVIMHHIYFKDCKWPCFSYVRILCCFSKRKSTNRKTNSKPNKDNKRAVNCGDSFLSCTARSSPVDVHDGLTNEAFEMEKDMEYGFLPVDHDNARISYIVVGEDADSLKRKSKSNVINTTNYLEENSDINNQTKRDVNKKEKKILVRFFRDHFYRFVTHRIAGWLIVICLSVLVILFTYSAVRLEPDNEQVQYYRDGHNYEKALRFDSNGFVSSGADRNVAVYIVWGLHPRDISGCHFSDQFCEGVERYDDSFDPNTPQAQVALMNFCDTLLKFSPQQIEDFHIRRDLRTGRPEIKCFMKELRDYLWRESLATGVDWSLPWDYTKTLTFMWNRPQLYDTSKFNQSFRNFLQIPVSFWLNDGYRYWNKTGFHDYHPLIGEATGPFSSPLKMDYTVFYGNKVKYLGVEVNLTLGRFATGYKTGKPVMDRWENFVSSQMRQMPPGLQKGFQITRSLWHTLSIQKTMADNAIFGIVLGIMCALPILTLATRNIIIGFFATFSMCCTTVCVIGVLPLAGWKLGILESLNMCMVVGLSVDYVVHLAEGYHMSAHADRMSRVRDMLEEVGISVFSGACTTLGASIFMLFAQIQFLVKFGIFMFCTIGFSLIFSLGFFTTIMGLLGPSGNTGDIRELCNKILSLRKRRKPSQTGTPQSHSSIEEADSERL